MPRLKAYEMTRGGKTFAVIPTLEIIKSRGRNYLYGYTFTKKGRIYWYSAGILFALDDLEKEVTIGITQKEYDFVKGCARGVYAAFYEIQEG